MNGSPHGVCFNHNTALRAARGEWIKILHDDDVLRPNCLEVLAHIVRERENVIAVSCAVENFRDGRLVRPFSRRDRGVLEQINPGDALLAMYILDEAGWARPTEQMVHRSIVDLGVLFEEAPGIKGLYDSWFNARVRARGATLVYNLPLVEWHQGQHETITSGLTEDHLTAEFLAFRRLVLPMVPKDRHPPNLKSVESMVMVIRALTDIRNGEFGKAIRVLFHIRDPRAYFMTVRWVLRQYYPRRFSSIARTIVWRDETEMAAVVNATATVMQAR
jgi:hypothetical protein